MKKSKTNWRRIWFAAIASFAFFSVLHLTVAAQSDIQFNKLYNCPDSSMYNFKVLECDGKDCKVLFVNTYTPSASFESKVLKSKITDAFKTGGCTIDGKKLEAVKDEPQEEENPKTTPNKTDKTSKEEPTKTEETKQRTGGCPLDEPAGTVSANSKPSAETFKRVIFEFYKGNANGRKVGINYQTFTLGKSYVNRLTNNGLLYDGAPQGAMIYPVKTKFSYCDQHTDSTILWKYDAQYSCFKDKFGDWVCPSDAAKISEPTYLPNK